MCYFGSTLLRRWFIPAGSKLIAVFVALQLSTENVTLVKFGWFCLQLHGRMPVQFGS
jgi:hypothetical protein